MTQLPPVFGRRRLKPDQSSADDRSGSSTSAAPLARVVFGKRCGSDSGPDDDLPGRSHETVEFTTIARARLEAICKDLRMIYHNEAAPDAAPHFRVMVDPAPCLLIGRYGVVTLDPKRGVFVFAIDGRKPGKVTIETASEEWLMDHIICHLALDRGVGLSVSTYGLISNLVGGTLADVERSLILATLRHLHFNRTHAAAMLGISIRTMRNKLRCYRDEGDGQPDAGMQHNLFRLRSLLPQRD